MSLLCQVSFTFTVQGDVTLANSDMGKISWSDSPLSSNTKDASLLLDLFVLYIVVVVVVRTTKED